MYSDRVLVSLVGIILFEEIENEISPLRMTKSIVCSMIQCLKMCVGRIILSFKGIILFARQKA